MDTNLFLQNNDNLVPRDQVRIKRVAAALYEDHRRVKVEVDVTPFRERPNMEITIRDSDGKIAAVSSVIASMHFKMEFTLHLKGNPSGDYVVQVQLYYDDSASPQDVSETQITT